MQRLDKKTRLKIYEEAINKIKLFVSESKPGHCFMCQVLTDAIPFVFEELKAYGNMHIFPELWAQKPSHIDYKSHRSWFYTNEFVNDVDSECIFLTPKEANLERIKFLEKAICNIQHNPLPAYQNLKPI